MGALDASAGERQDGWMSCRISSYPSIYALGHRAIAEWYKEQLAGLAFAPAAELQHEIPE